MNCLDDLKKELPDLEKKLGLTFKNHEIIIQACCHSSFVNENKKKIDCNNERLEFLGDAALGAVMSEYLYCNYDDPEGELSKMKSQIVDATSCVKYIEYLGIEEFLLLGKGQQIEAHRGRNKAVANFFEAIIGAILLDHGYSEVKRFVNEKLRSSIEEILNDPTTNYKAQLQELSQQELHEKPVYLLVSEEGPDHEKIFTVEVYVNDIKQGVGTGKSKKLAEQMAAQSALEKLQKG